MERAGWTTLQRIEFVLIERARLAKELSKQVNEPVLTKHLKNVRLADSSEPMNKSFVDCCLTIESRLMSIASCRSVLRAFEEESPNMVNTPLNSVYKLNAIISKARVPEDIEWTMQALYDGFKMGYIHIGEFSVVKLSQILCSCALLQKEFKEGVFRFIDKHHFKSEFNAKIREYLSSHSKCRQTLTNRPGDAVNDIAFLSAWPQSSAMILTLAESIIYGDSYKSSMRNCIQARKSVLEFVEYPSVKTELDKCLQQLEAEATTPACDITMTADDEKNGTPTASPITHAVGAENTKLEEAVKALEETQLKDLNRELDKHVRRYCSFNVYPTHMDELKTMTESSELTKQAGDGSGFAMILFNADAWCDAASQPRSRKPPVPDKLYERAAAAIMMGRFRGEDASNATLNEGDLACCLDGSRPGLVKRLIKPWVKGLAKTTKLEGEDAEDDLDDDADPGDVE
eukprot:5145608-Pyramimonas_sp.AAC.1